MNEVQLELGGLRTIVVNAAAAPRSLVIMLHGYEMRPEALSPFATSIGIGATFLMPEGPVVAEPEGRAWWEIDVRARASQMAVGPRDLASSHPPGVAYARERFLEFFQDVRTRWRGLPVALVGFSQGGMLACDVVLRDRLDISALGLLSSSRIALDEWTPLLPRMRDMRVLVSHGEHDPDLAFSAGEALRDMCLAAGALVTWVPFDGAHEIPLVVWRALKKFLTQGTAE